MKPQVHNLKCDEVFVHSNSAVKEEKQQHFNPCLTSWVLIMRKGNILVHSLTGGSRFPPKKRCKRDIFVSANSRLWDCAKFPLPPGFAVLRTGTSEATVLVLFCFIFPKSFSFHSPPVEQRAPLCPLLPYYPDVFNPAPKAAFCPFATLLQGILPFSIIIFTAMSSA